MEIEARSVAEKLSDLAGRHFRGAPLLVDPGG
jgi:hypothetical protein